MHNRGHARTVRRRVCAERRRQMMQELHELARRQGRPARARQDRRGVAATRRRQRRRAAVRDPRSSVAGAAAVGGAESAAISPEWLAAAETVPRDGGAAGRGDGMTAPAMLSAQSRRVLLDSNAGGSSHISEAFSLELMARKFGAVLIETESEMQAKADPNTPLLDYTVHMHGRLVGVSVTRAMAPPHAPNSRFELRDALSLLRKKLKGLRKARGAWDRRVLHVWAESERVERLVCEAAVALQGDMPRDTCVMVSLAPSFRALFDEGKGARSRAADPNDSLPPGLRRYYGLTRRVRGSRAKD